MIKKEEHLTDYIANTFDLSRIQTLPITDKFTLVYYIKLVGRASSLANDKGIPEIINSPLYEMDRSFYLLISLIHAGINPMIISDVIEDYSFNFDDSDIYYAKLVILGAGTLMIQKGIDSDAIISYLITFLGNDFLKSNFQRLYRDKDQLEIEEEDKIVIKYKNFDYTYRKLKYDLLALLKIKKEKGYETLRQVIYEKCENNDLKLYFKLLDIKDAPTLEYIYRQLMKNSPKMDRFILTACRAMCLDHTILQTHYQLNAVIGKYTRFDKPYSEVIDEIEMREKEILE